MNPASPPAPTDGRRARTERGRTAAIDAMIDLIQQGAAPLTGEKVAEQAGVSVSSLFRYFETLQDLQAATIDRFIDRYAEFFEVPGLGVGRLSERIETYVQARLNLYSSITQMARLARYRAYEHEHLRDLLARMRSRQLAQAIEHFDLDGSLAEMVVTLTSFESWDQLHTDHGRSRTEIAQQWTAALEALVRAGRADSTGGAR